MKAAVVLSGCGVYDGAEIHEAVMTLYAIDKNGGSYQIFAPNVAQHHVINHLTGEEMKESRNVLTEAARIARGKIKALTEYRTEEFDVLIFPGGFGTLDEFFEALTLIQTQKIADFPLILMGSEFWNGMMDWIRGTMMKQHRNISPEDLKHIFITDSPAEAVSIVRKAWDIQRQNGQYKNGFLQSELIPDKKAKKSPGAKKKGGAGSPGGKSAPG